MVSYIFHIHASGLLPLSCQSATEHEIAATAPETHAGQAPFAGYNSLAGPVPHLETNLHPMAAEKAIEYFL